MKKRCFCIIFSIMTILLSFCSSSSIPKYEEMLKNQETLKKAKPLPNEVLNSYLEYTSQSQNSSPMNTRLLDQNASFWIPDFQKNQFIKIDARLISIGKYGYLWLDVNNINKQKRLVSKFEEFDQKYAPLIYSKFHFISYKGIDNDPKTIILVSDEIAGTFYYSSSEIPSEVNPFSNQQEIIYLNASELYSGGAGMPLLGHELQHLLHWMVDPDEESWVSEGLSTLTETYINTHILPILGFNNEPDIQLNTWDINGDNYSRYGASFLFFKYIEEQYGDVFLGNIISNENNGFEAIEQEFLLNDHGLIRKGNNSFTEQLFINWSIANILNQKYIEKGQFGYKDIVFSEKFKSQNIDSCSTDWMDFNVHQFGTDYFSINCMGKYRIEFRGDQAVKIINTDPIFSEYFFWSNRANESKMTLTRKFDFTNVNNTKILMNFWTWFDLEKNFDFVYVEISQDGVNWKVVLPKEYSKTCSMDGKICGFTGTNLNWHKETIDISSCAGKICNIRFVYMTDLAANGDGFSIGRITIPLIGYDENFNNSDGGWEARGFVRILNYLPQKFNLSILNSDGNGLVTHATIDSNNHFLSDELEGKMILVINGLTDNTTQLGQYRIRVISEDN